MSLLALPLSLRSDELTRSQLTHTHKETLTHVHIHKHITLSAHRYPKSKTRKT